MQIKDLFKNDAEFDLFITLAAKKVKDQFTEQDQRDLDALTTNVPHRKDFFEQLTDKAKLPKYKKGLKLLESLDMEALKADFWQRLSNESPAVLYIAKPPKHTTNHKRTLIFLAVIITIAIVVYKILK